MTSTDFTREDARRYVLTALQDHAADFDVEAITDDVRQQLGTWDFTTLNHEPSPVHFWGVVLRHATDRLDQVPDCPDWCTLPAGHRFESIEADGTLVGYHEGPLATVPGADVRTAAMVDYGRKITRGTDGTTVTGPLFVTVSAEGVEFTDPHVLRDLGDAIRAAARKLEQG